MITRHLSNSLISLLYLAEVPLDSITLDTDRGLVEEGSSLNTANTRVILSSQPQARVSSQPQTLVTGMVQLSHCSPPVLISPFYFSNKTQYFCELNL